MVSITNITDPAATQEIGSFTTRVDTTEVNGVYAWEINTADSEYASIFTDELVNGLVDGNYSYTITTTDIAGNTTEITPADDTFEIDNTDPSITPFDLVSDTVKTNYTTDTSPTFTGTINDASAVSVTLNITDSEGTDHTVTIDIADANGVDTEWSIDLSNLPEDAQTTNLPQALPDGVTSYSITVMDAAGNEISSSTKQFTVQTTNTLSGVMLDTSDSGVDDTHNYTNPDLNDGGDASDDTAITFAGSGEIGTNVTITISDGTNTIIIGDDETVTIDSDGKWSYSLTKDQEGLLQDGSSYEYTISSTNSVGITKSISNEGIVQTATIDGVVVELSRENATGYNFIVDKTAPTTAVVDGLTDDSDTEALQADEQNDNITKVNPVIEGSFSADEITTDGEILINSVEVVLLQVTTDGVTTDVTPETSFKIEGDEITGSDWTIPVDMSGLENGTYTYKVILTDLAGNTSEQTLDSNSTTLQFELDTIAPDAPVNDGFGDTTDFLIHTDDAINTGDSEDNVTSESQPSFTGTAEKGATVTISFEGGGSYTTTADVTDGTWTIKLAEEGVTLEDDTYTYTVYAEDTAGNKSTSVQGEVVIDSSLPKVKLELQPAQSVANDTWENETDDTLKAELENLSTSTTSVIDGNESYTVPLLGEATPVFTGEAEAGTTVTLTITDMNNTSSIYTYEVVITGDETDSTQGSYTVKNANTGTTISTGDITFNAQGAGTWTVTIPDSESLAVNTQGTASYKYEVTATDVAGNEASQENITIVTPTVDGRSVDAGYFALDTKTSVSNATLSTGVNNDTGTSQSDGVTYNQQPWFNGEGEVGATVEVQILDASNNVMSTASTLVQEDGTWSVQVATELDPGLTDGTYSANITATDTSGNQATTSIDSINIDTVAPIATDITSITPLSGAGEDEGTTNDFITSATTTHISGTVTDIEGQLESGSIVYLDVYQIDPTTGDRIDDGISTSSQATVTSSNTWSAEVEFNNIDTYDALTFGYDVRIEDAAGNKDDSILSTTTDNSLQTFTIDRLQLSLSGYEDINTNTAISDDKGDYLGNGNANFYTQYTTFNAIGVIEDNAVDNYEVTVTQLVGGEEVALAAERYTLNVSGTEWALTFNGLDQGAYTYSIQATDDNGITRTITNTVHVDTEAPDAPDNIMVNDEALSTTEVNYLHEMTFTGTAEANSTVTLYLNKSDSGEEYKVTAETNDNGVWEMIIDPEVENIPLGQYDYSFTATDLAGNEGDESTAYQVDYDTTDPVFESVILNAGTANDADGDLAGDAAWWVVGTQGELGVTVTLSDSGAHTSNSLQLALSVDGENTTVTNNNDGTYTVDFSSLSFGEHKLVFTATDENGNVTTYDKWLNYDNAVTLSASLSAESDTGSSSDDEITNEPDPILTGITDANALVSIWSADGSTKLGDATVSASGVWTYQLSGLTTDSYQYLVKATSDDAGSNEVQTTVSFSVDVDAPILSTVKVSALTDADGDGNSDDIVTGTSVDTENATSSDIAVPTLSTSYNWVRIEGVLDAENWDSTVRIYVGGQWHTNVEVNDSGFYSLDISLPAKNDAYDYQVEATDTAGNVTISATGEIYVEPSTVSIDINDAASTDSLGVGTDDSGQEQLLINGDVGDGAKLTLKGTTAAGASYTVYLADANGDILTSDGSTPIYSVTDSASETDGSWTISDIDIDPLNLQDGYQFIISSSGRTDSIEVVQDKDITITDIDVLGSVEDGIEYFNTTGDIITGTTDSDATITIELTNTTTDAEFTQEHVSVNVAANGTFTISNTGALTDGSYSYKITSTDTTGNKTSYESDTSTSFVVDTTAPVQDTVSSLTLKQVDDTSTATIVSSGSVIAEDSVEFSGTIDLNDSDYNKVTLAVKNLETGDTTSYVIRPDSTSIKSTDVEYVEVDSSGTWSLTLNDLIDTEYSYSFITQDSAGNQTTQHIDSGSFTVKTSITDADLSYELLNADGDNDAGYTTSDADFDVQISTQSTTNVHVVATLLDKDGNPVAGIEAQEIDISSTDGNQTIHFASLGDAVADDYKVSLAITDAYNNSTTKYMMNIDYIQTVAELNFTLPENTGDSATSNALVTLTSSVEDGNSWMYTLDGNAENPTWFVGSGTSFALSDNSYGSGDIQVKQIDVNGNESVATSSTANLIVDTVDPNAPVIALQEDTGITGDHKTSNGTILVSELEADVTWYWSIDGTDWYKNTQTISSGDVIVSGDTFTLPEGFSGSVQVKQVDGAGNEAITTLNSIEITGSLGSVDMTLPVDGENIVTVDSSDITGDSWMYTLDGDADNPTWYVGGSSYQFALEDGSYAENAIQVKQVDANGEESVTTKSGDAFSVDTLAPNAPIITLDSDTGISTDYITTDGTINVNSLPADAESWSYTYKLNGVETGPFAGSGDAFELTDVGVYTEIQVIAKDAVGNESVPATIAQVEIVAAPSDNLTIELPDNTTATTASDNAIVSVAGMGTNSWMYTLNGSAENPTWYVGDSSQQFVLADGSYNKADIQIKQIDANGNESTAVSAGESGTFTIDTVAPIATSITLDLDTGTTGDNITTDTTIQVNGLEVGATWQYSTDGGENWSTGVVADSTTATFELAPSSLPAVYNEGDILVRQTDTANNTTAEADYSQNTASITIQGALASESTLVIDLPDNAITSDMTVSVSGISSNADAWQYSTDGGQSWTTGDAANASGESSFELADGSYGATDIQVRQMNSVQSEDNIAATVVSAGNISVDTSTPTGPVVSYNHTGEDGQTNDASVTISGITESNWEYSIDGGSTWKSDVSATNGIATITLSDGSNSIKVVQTNEAGTLSSTKADATAISVELDTDIPNLVTITAGTNGYTADDGFDVSDIEDGASWKYSINNGDWITGTTTNVSGVFTDSNTSYTVQIAVTDAAGNTSITGKTVIYDNEDPAVLTVTLDDTSVASSETTSNGAVNISGIESGASWQYRINGEGEWITGGTSATGTASFTLPDSDGATTKLEVRQVDQAGNTSGVASSTSIVVDTAAPAISASVSGNTISGYTSEDTTLTFGIDANGNNVIDSDEVITTLQADAGAWSLEDVTSEITSEIETSGLALSGDGSDLTLSISATDSAGNTSLDNLDLLMNVDTEAPALIGDVTITDDVAGDGTDGWINDNQPTFEGTTESGSTVRLTVDGESYEVVSSDSGSWSITPGTEINDGTHNYYINVVDSAGNESNLDNTTVTGTIKVDASAPTYSSDSVADTVSYTESDGAITSISFDVPEQSGAESGVSDISALLMDENGDPIDGVTLNPTLSEANKVTIDLSTTGETVTQHDVSHDIVITITDAAGNETQVDTDI